MITVLASGCFDVLHYGHVLHLRQARAMGDRLIVALTEDDFVGKGPGRPVNTWPHRAAVLRELRCVDLVVPAVSSVSAIREWRPQVFVKGIDYAGGDRFTEDVVEACRLQVCELRFTDTPKMSATEIIKRHMELA
jgi:D-beta-D-heptose 7-phosphate kinase/D-beta-D-heptose 1-phosphate adenosyltransferase